ncbi:MAG: RNA polymerase sigma-70 factor [Bacteroidota bacterium]
MEAKEAAQFQEIKNGNRRAFEEVFRLYYEPLCRFCLRFLQSQEEAEEVVQDLFVAFWEKKNELELTVSIKSYLYRAARNRSLNVIKHQQVKDRYVGETTFLMRHSYEEVSFTSELEAAIAKGIDALPERCREIFLLSRHEGLKYREIADLLGISPKTVEVQMSKALKSLREHLKEFLVIWWLFWMNHGS